MKVFNVSTGKAVKVSHWTNSLSLKKARSPVSITQGGSSKLASAALCLAFDSTHSQLWVGDSKVSGCGSEYVQVNLIHLHRDRCTTSV